MNFFYIFVIALALAMDAFTVSVGISLSLKELTRQQVFRISFHFGFFQFMMPIIGWGAGQYVMKSIQAVDHWVAFGLLLLIGFKMMYESIKKEKQREKKVIDQTKGFPLILLSVATSIDALAVGLSFAVLRVVILYPAIVIGIVAFLVTIIGAKIGPVLGQIFGRRAEFVGGLVLILIGAKILFEHL